MLIIVNYKKVFNSEYHITANVEVILSSEQIEKLKRQHRL